MKLGNIIYNGDLINHEMVDYINYYRVELNNIDAILVNLNKLPTLIVGYSLFKKLFIDKFPDQSILDKKVIPNKLYWEFSFAENKKQNLEGIEFFVNENLVKYYFFDFTYKNIDPLFDNLKINDDLFKIFIKPIEYVYIEKRMIYVISNNIIHGIDKETFTFFNFNVKNIIDFLIEKSLKWTNDEDNKIYESYYKQFPEFDLLKRYIPLFEMIK